RRKALYIAVASLGALVWLEDGVIREARLALGSVAPTVVRPREIERALAGRPLTAEALTELRDALSSVARPISDLRASADYRRQVAGNILLDLAHTVQTTGVPPKLVPPISG
ncbi:TPA: molybdopterin dehydrogenase, partial [Candidatus Acetothermia bacterium]|nr:molybdopterin dehydrogenase [Candidatus Acetothermia bacterium]